MQSRNDENFSNYQQLASAIVSLAIDDYCTLYETYYATDNTDEEARCLKEIRHFNNFFRSEYFTVISNIDPTYIIKILPDKIRQGEKPQKIYTAP